MATDGETFGHHRGGAEKTLAHTVINELPSRGWQVTSYAHYLGMCSPTWEVQLKPATAWSCSRGVNRWHRDCGCGGGGGWQQQWASTGAKRSVGLAARLFGDTSTANCDGFAKDPWAALMTIQVLNSTSDQVLSSFLPRIRLIR